MDLTYNTNIRKDNERIDNLISLTNIFLSYSKAEKTNFNRYIIDSLKKLHPLTFEDLKSNDSCILKFRLWVFSFRLIC